MEWTPIVDCVYDATITVPSISDNTFAVTIQLKDFAGNNLKVPAAIQVYVASNPTGLTITTLTSEISTTSNGDGAVLVLLANYSWLLISEVDGGIAIDCTDTTNEGIYLVLVMPDGRLVVSDVMKFTT